MILANTCDVHKELLLKQTNTKFKVILSSDNQLISKKFHLGIFLVYADISWNMNFKILLYRFWDSESSTSCPYENLINLEI